MKKKKGYSRNWSLVSYIEDLQVILDIIEEHKNIIVYYAIILHNKDILDNGEKKQSHYHISLILNNTRTEMQVRKWFEILDKNDNKINCLAQQTIDNSAIIEYFIHKNCKEKYQYSDKDIVSNNINAFVTAPPSEDNCYLILQDMICGVKIYDLVKRYGKDFVYHYNQYRALVSDILNNERELENLEF